MRRSVFLLLAATSIGAACGSARARPVQATIEGTVGIAAGEDIGTMEGYGARLASNRFAFAASRAEASSHPNTITCRFEPEEPDGCRSGPVVQRDEMLRFSVGVVRSWESERLLSFATPYAGIAVLEQEQHALMTGARDSGSGGGLQLGIAAGSQYNLIGPFWVGALLDAALIMPYQPGTCADCSIPYEDWIGLAGLSLTASWRLP